MKDFEQYTDGRFTIQIKDGIVYIVYVREYVDYDYVNDLITIRSKMTRNKTLPMFSDFRAVKRGTREARERMAAKDGGIGVSAVAVFVNSKVQRVIYNFFHSIYKAPAPAKLFTDKEKALAWLEQFK